jgi:hypothetical protein
MYTVSSSGVLALNRQNTSSTNTTATHIGTNRLIEGELGP